MLNWSCVLLAVGAATAAVSPFTKCGTNDTMVNDMAVLKSAAADPPVHNDHQPLYMTYAFFIDFFKYEHHLNSAGGDVAKTQENIVDQLDQRAKELVPIWKQIKDENGNAIQPVLTDIVFQVSPDHGLDRSASYLYRDSINNSTEIGRLFGSRVDVVIAVNQKGWGSLAGAGNWGSMCRKEKGMHSNAVWIKRLNSAGLAAHETAHTMYIPHDGKNCVPPSPNAVMAGSGKTFSNCSLVKGKNYIKFRLDNNHKGQWHNCFLDNPYAANGCKCHDEMPTSCRQLVRERGCEDFYTSECSKDDVKKNCKYSCEVCSKGSGGFCPTGDEANTEKCEDKRRGVWTLGKNWEFTPLPY